MKKGVVAHACNPSTQEVEAGKSQTQRQSGIHSEILFPLPKTKNKKHEESEWPQTS
jgi:hypothetical protein